MLNRWCTKCGRDDQYLLFTKQEMKTYLVRNDESAKEDALAGPLLECDLEVGLCAVDVCEGDEECGDLDLRLVDHVCDEVGELRML